MRGEHGMGTCSEPIAENKNVKLVHFRLFFLPLPKSTAVTHHGRRHQLPRCSQRFRGCPNLLLSSAADRSGTDPSHPQHQNNDHSMETCFQKPDTLRFILNTKEAVSCSCAGMGDCARLGRVRLSGRWGRGAMGRVLLPGRSERQPLRV